MATSARPRIWNPLELLFRPTIAPEAAYELEPVPRENKTRRQRMLIENIRHRNHCKRVKFDTEASFEMMVSEVKNVMKDANHLVWKDLEMRVNEANEVLHQVGVDLKMPPRQVECAELTRMSKITMTIAGYLQTQKIKSEAIRADMDKVLKVLMRTMSVGVANIPRNEHKSLIRNLFRLVILVREEKKPKTKPAKCQTEIVRDIRKEVEQAAQAFKGLRITQTLTFGLIESAYLRTEKPETPESYIDDIMTFTRPV